MISFYQFLENINESLVHINLKGYEKEAFKKAEELLSYAKERKENLQNFKLDINLIKNGLKNFPFLSQILIFLSGEINEKKLYSWINAIRNYEEKIRNELKEKHKKEKEEIEKLRPKSKYPAYASNIVGEKIPNEYYKKWHEMHNRHTKEQKEFYEISSVIYHLNDYFNSKNIEPLNEKEYYDLANKAIEKTNKNMINIKSKIENIISILDWKGSKVRILPSMPDSDEDPVPNTDSATIVVGKDALFSYFSDENGKFIIDDIIEGGEEEEDFFANDDEKQDYYNLISQLQNPNKKYQILTLYTARPTKDREFYNKTDYLPANIFLSNSFNHVDGLAGDLSSTDERRDIYKIKINSKYLIKTLDGPIKYYQVIKDAPVEYIGLY